MSRLPNGTLATRSFLESLMLKGALAQVYAWAPWLNFPVVRNIVEAIITKALIKPVSDEATALALAGVYVIDHAQFVKAFIALKTIEGQGASPAALEGALKNAENAMARFIRRGPLT